MEAGPLYLVPGSIPKHKDFARHLMSGVRCLVARLLQECGRMGRARFSRVGPCRLRKRLLGERGMSGGQCVVGRGGGRGRRGRSGMCR